MVNQSVDPVAAQLKRLSEVVAQVGAGLDRVEKTAAAWQERVETKVDLQLDFLKGCQLLATTLQSAGELGGKVHPVWYDRSLEKSPVEQVYEKSLSGDLPGTVGSTSSDSLDASRNQITSAQLPEKTRACESSAQEAGERCDPPQNNSASSGVGRISRDESSRDAFLKKSASKTKGAQSGMLGAKTVFTKKKKADNFVSKKRRDELFDRQSKLLRFTSDRRYEVGVMMLIVLNAICIGWQVQVIAYRVEESFILGTSYDTSAPTFFLVLQTVFNFTFLVELLLRWMSEGFIGFIYSVDAIWNLLDIVTVVAGLVELLIVLAQDDSQIVASISLIRILRILRVVRLVKLIRVYPFFHELRMMVESCLNSVKSYMWCILVLLLMTYVFGIYMTTGTCSYLSEQKKMADHDRDSAILHSFFGTVDKSMLSLFQTIAGGRDWYEFYEALDLLESSKKWIYLLYISFAMFAVCNVVAAVFVESAMQSSQHDRELLIREALRDSQAYQEKMMCVFNEMDADGTGTLTEDEFLSHLDDSRVIAYFDSLKLDVSDATSLFKLLDIDHSGSVEIMEFIEGCHRLKGESRTLDMHLMRYELQATRFELHDLALKFYSYAEVHGMPNLKERVLATNEKLPSPSHVKQMRRPSLRCAANSPAQVAPEAPMLSSPGSAIHSSPGSAMLDRSGESIA